jgi:hypothetical protein
MFCMRNFPCLSVSPRAPWLLVGAISASIAAAPANASMRIGPGETGIEVFVGDDGLFEVTTRDPVWRFSGNVGGSSLSGLVSQRNADLAGTYQRIEFQFRSADAAGRAGSIRLYDHRPVVVFEVAFLTPGDTTEAFPSISTYPPDLHHLTYTSTFGGFSFEQFGADGPWVLFDDQANAAIFSPASHFMNARLAVGPHGEWVTAIAADPPRIPAGFTQSTVLVVEPGINRAFEAWGHFLTDLAGKRRPPNDADFGLQYLGYWTDHGARYYYGSEPGLDYVDTLLRVRDEFDRMNIRLGYVQLDSWFYPKGHDGRWSSADPLGGGTYIYEASPELFPRGLADFQKTLGRPLIAHNRWIDAQSPYRAAFQISGNVAVDPRLWAQWMDYARASGIGTYEQDWLSGPATPEPDLLSGERFMDTMAEAARLRGLTLQYCMPLPRHFLQGTRYSNLTTIRTSGDRFGRDKWKSFLFNGRLASALGEWPWTDVFDSSETSNILLATLSAAMVGTGDPIGQFDRTNLLRAARPDGVIVKPDTAIVPHDRTYVEAAQQLGRPLVASASTRHRAGTTTYLFAAPDPDAAGDQAPDENRHVDVIPSTLGYQEPVYAYNYFDRYGAYLHPSDRIEFKVPDNGMYWIVVPVGRSGVGFLGDADKFASNGTQRIAWLDDTGELSARVMFAEGESRVHLHGFSATPPEVRTAEGAIENLAYDTQTRRFRFDLVGSGFADIAITASSVSGGRKP